VVAGGGANIAGVFPLRTAIRCHIVR
jgi:hypothetical protein